MDRCVNRKAWPRLLKDLPARPHVLCMVEMADDRASAAMGRIERALARIDTALARPPSSAGNDLAVAELTSRHESLRNETKKALAELDAIIGNNG